MLGSQIIWWISCPVHAGPYVSISKILCYHKVLNSPCLLTYLVLMFIIFVFCIVSKILYQQTFLGKMHTAMVRLFSKTNFERKAQRWQQFRYINTCLIRKFAKRFNKYSRIYKYHFCYLGKKKISSSIFGFTSP